MILVDTGVIIDFWKKPTDKKKQVFLKEETAICGVVKAELMHGAKDENQLRAIKEALSDFKYIPMEENLWENIGTMLFRLRKRGIAVPFQDVIISALALNYNLVIWSNDKHFKLIKKEFPILKLFEQK